MLSVLHKSSACVHSCVYVYMCCVCVSRSTVHETRNETKRRKNDAEWGGEQLNTCNMTAEGGYRRLKDTGNGKENLKNQMFFFFENAIAKPNTFYADLSKVVN